MLRIIGYPGKDLCDRHLGVTRRDILRVGGSGMLGMTLGTMLQLKSTSASPASANSSPERRGWEKAKSIILVYLQGGPSHIDLWDPKENVPDNVKSVFKSIPTKIPGIHFTENLPQLSQLIDRFTLIRSLSYTPNGLFNHTAAIYQMMTGYTTDKVSPSGQLEPPSPKDFPNFGSHIVRFRPIDVPMLPFVMLPRPLQESNVVGKGGSAGFLGKAFDPYTLFPDGDDMDMSKMRNIKIDDLRLPPEVFSVRLRRRARLRELVTQQMPELEKAVEPLKLNQHYQQALDLVASGRAREAFDLTGESEAIREKYGRNTFGDSCLLARRLIEAGTRVVEVIWPKVANSDNHSWDQHQDLSKRMKDQSAPMFDRGLSALIEDLDGRGMLSETLLVAVGEFGRSPQRGVSTSGNDNSADGRDHWPYCYTGLIAGAGIRRGYVHGKSDKTASAPIEDPVHPAELLATIYHAFGIDPEQMVMNHLNQPRELVKSLPVTALFA
jgi:hypothetical protein